MLTYLRNCWYAAAYSEELGEAPLERKLLDRDMVLFRDGTGIAALEDRCPHRFAPLSAGEVVNGTIRCPYHGLQFDRSGACTHNPHMKGGGPLRAARVTAWVVMERYGIIWVWPGDPERADPEALPKIAFLEQPERFSVVKGRLHVRGNYELVVDNLLDLSHAAYIHPQFAGGQYTTEELLAATTQRLERRERSVINHRMRSGLAAPAPSQLLFGFPADAPTHIDSTMTWHPPAMLDFSAGSWLVCTEREDGAHIPQLHFITPETEFSSHYFFVNGRNQRRDDPEVDQALLDMFQLAFGKQDEPMIEMVQRRMGHISDINQLNPVLLATDAAPVSARRILARLIAEENNESQPADGLPEVPTES